MWDENLKVTQAKHDKYSKKEYEERLENIQHNYDYLIQNLESEEYDEHFDLINKVGGHEDTIEVLLKI